jgi:hypothetical protein
MFSTVPNDTTVRDARDDERAAIRALTLRAYAEIADVMAPSAWAGLEQVLHERLGAITSAISAYARSVSARIAARSSSRASRTIVSTEPKADMGTMGRT